MLKNFYALAWIVKFLILTPLLIAGFIPLFYVMDMNYGLMLIPIVIPFANFALIPFTRILGFATYLSPMVLTFGKDIKDYQLHNVQSFDYFVNFKWSERGRAAKRKLLRYYMEALLEIIRRIDTGELPESLVVVGNSYFFNERTTQKLGFTIGKANIYRILNSVISFVEISLLFSFTEGKLSLPKLWNVKKASITGTVLLEKKGVIERYYSLLGE